MVNKQLIGKFMVRKSKTQNGELCLILCGAFHPQNFELNEIKDNDEMWVANIEILPGGLKFTNPKTNNGLRSPEDFLEGEGMSSDFWKTKEEL